VSVLGPADVRFGSEADICVATSHVRSTPNSDHESEFRQNAIDKSGGMNTAVQRESQNFFVYFFSEIGVGPR